MEGDAGGLFEFTGPGLDADAIEDEIDDFPCAAGERGDLRLRVILELEEIAVAVHSGAGAGGHDDRKVTREYFRGVPSDFARGLPIARVEGGLPAAGLVFRILN